MALKKLIKRFEFVNENRSRFDLTGGLRLNPDTQRLEIPREPATAVASAPAPEYKMDQTFTAKTWLANPLRVKKWLLFQVEHPQPPNHPEYGQQAFDVQYRLLNGTGAFYWDGGAWAAATLDAHWNTEADVAENIPTFPANDQTLGVEINMWTLHKSITPHLSVIKVLYETDVNEWSDLIYDSIVTELQETIKAESRIAEDLETDTTTYDLSTAGQKDVDMEASYNVDDVIGAYDLTDDPNRLINLRQAFDTGTKSLTLTAAVLATHRLLIEFSYSINCHIMTSSQFRELPSSPSIVILDPKQETVVERIQIDDSVFHVGTGAGWKVYGPRVADVSFMIELRTDKQRDSFNLQQQLRQWVTQTHEIRMRGTDESFYLEADDLDVTTFPNDSDMQTAKLSVRVKNVVFSEIEATETKKISGIIFAGGNLTLAALP